MGFYVPKEGDEYAPDDEDEEAAAPATQVEPGLIEQLPHGFSFESFNPDYPHAIFDPFVRRAIQKLASGLGVSYMSLSGDLTGTSFSSGRIGLLEEREMWKVLQAWLQSVLHGAIYPEWLEMAMLTGAVNLPLRKLEQFNRPTWQGRTWDWVDPKKDADARIAEKNANLRAPSAIVAERGGDYEEMCRQIKQDRETRERYGITDAELTAAIRGGNDG
jgi:lambda family phage portal protein